MSETVTVRLFAAARSAAGTGETTAAPGTLASVIDDLVARFPQVQRVTPMCSFLVDGLRSGPDAPVLPGATVDVLPPFAGG